MEAVRRMLSGLGVPGSQVHYEAFEAAVAQASREAEAPAVAVAAPATVASVTSLQAVAASTNGGCRLTLQRTGVTIPVGGTQTLLEAAEAAGSGIPSSCRAGVCGTCRTRLVSGTVDCDADSLDEVDREAGYILPCVSWAKGDCALDA
ncbi:MAG: 2Fe-2S iron-sulfur cluster-binding protein, partial [Thermoanaerobaculales bacterium]